MMNTTIARPALGQRCKVNARAGKRYIATKITQLDEATGRMEEYETLPTACEWERKNITPVDAIFAGYRFVQAGIIHEVEKTWHDDDDDPIEYKERVYTRTGTIELWLMVSDPRRKPFLVFPEDVEVNHAD